MISKKVNRKKTEELRNRIEYLLYQSLDKYNQAAKIESLNGGISNQLNGKILDSLIELERISENDEEKKNLIEEAFKIAGRQIGNDDNFFFISKLGSFILTIQALSRGMKKPNIFKKQLNFLRAMTLAA